MRTVIITGVSGGIGLGTATAFRADGWRVIGIDRRTPEKGVVDRFLQVDLADLKATAVTLGQLENEVRIDAVVNNAGRPMDKRLRDVSIEDWQSTLDVNVGGAFLTMQRLLPKLQSSAGAVVNVSSVHAVVSSPNVTAYAASKGALLALTRAAAIEMAPLGVRVNAVLPGAVDTPMLRAGVVRDDPDADVEAALKQLAERTPLRLIGDPADIAQGILFLADAGRSRFVTGQVLVIDGGATARLSTERE